MAVMMQERGMTVAELIKELQSYPGIYPVYLGKAGEPITSENIQKVPVTPRICEPRIFIATSKEMEKIKP